jgi:hypothetical protein
MHCYSYSLGYSKASVGAVGSKAAVLPAVSCANEQRHPGPLQQQQQQPKGNAQQACRAPHQPSAAQHFAPRRPGSEKAVAASTLVLLTQEWCTSFSVHYACASGGWWCEAAR